MHLIILDVIIPHLIKYLIMRKTLVAILVVLAFVLDAAAQDRTITGRILDDKGAPLSDVSVIVKGTSLGVNTDADGTIRLKSLPLQEQLLFPPLVYKPWNLVLTTEPILLQP